MGKLKPAFNFIVLFFASAGYLSYLPAAFIHSLKKSSTLADKKWTGAGFVGSVVGAATYCLAPASVVTSYIWVLAGLFFAVFISGLAENVLRNHDDSRIVIDEGIGIWIAFFGFSQTLSPELLVAFFLFRVFDVWKCPPMNRLQHLPGGWGVTMDDVAAGVFANVLTRLIFYFV